MISDDLTQMVNFPSWLSLLQSCSFGFVYFLRNVPREDIFKFGASAAAKEFCKWVYIGIDVHIFIVINIRSSLIHVHGLINLPNLRSSSDRVVIIVKGFLNLPNLHILIKLKSLITSQKLGSQDLWWMVFSTKVNMLYFLYSTAWRCCILHLVKYYY